MRPPSRSFISPQEANYIELLLGDPNPKGKEAALERLCSHYRGGRRLHHPHNVCQILTGLLYHENADVRRWTFNAIALVGNKSQNLEAILHALELNRSDEDTFAAGMAALVALTNEIQTEAHLKKIGVELEGAVLIAAAQQADSYSGRLAKHRINLDSASPTELRLAAVLVGLDKAPEHLFTLGHQNSAVIGNLHSHEDRRVGQYAAWAVCEHPALGLTHLGFKPAQLRDQPVDIRKYGFRLLTADDATAAQHFELIAEATFDPETKAREGLAIGLIQSYTPGLEEITLDWLARESDGPIREAIIDHFVAHSERCTVYEGAAKDAYNTAAIGSIIRAKLMARAEGKPIFKEFRKIDFRNTTSELFDSDANLFGATTVNKTINISGGNVGVVSETADVRGGINQTINYVERAQNHLGALLDLVGSSGLNPDLKREGSKLAEEARKKPTKTAVEKVLRWLGNIKTVTGLTAGTIENFDRVGDGLAEVLQHLPIG